MPKPSRKHHFVPRHLLANFAADDGSITIYDLKRAKRWQASPDHAGFERDLYAFSGLKGRNYDGLEKELNLAFDAPGALAIAALLRKEKLSIPMVHNFIGFMGLQFVRTPAHFERMEVMTDALNQEMLRRMAAHSVEFRSNVTRSLKKSCASDETIARLLHEAATGGMIVKTHKQQTLASALKSIQTVCDSLIKRRWAILDVAPGDPDLVITDNPFVLVDMSKSQNQTLGVANRLVDVYFPLSSRVVALGSFDGEVCYGELCSGVARDINGYLFSRARRFVYSSENSDDIEREAMRQHGTGPKMVVQRITLTNGGLITQSVFR